MDITTLFNNFGVWGLSGILMLETGFLPLFFLPGDTLLFTAGYLIHAGDLPINNVFIILSLGAFLGNIIGYFLGFFAEKSLMKFVRNKAVFNKRIEKTHKFYEKYGLVTLVFARFIPSVRTIAPFLAGVALMPFLPFLLVSFFLIFRFDDPFKTIIQRKFGDILAHLDCNEQQLADLCTVYSQIDLT